MEEWKKMKLGDIIEFNPVERVLRNTICRKVSMDKLTPYTRDIYDFEYESYTGGTKFKNGDTIMARITPCLENGKTAHVSFLDTNEVAFGSTEYIVLREKKGISDSKFIYYLAISPEIRKIAIKSMVGSSGRQRVQLDVLENYSMVLPQIQEQKEIAKILSSLDDKIAINRRINDNLEQQAQALYKSWFVDFESFKDGKFVDSEVGGIPEGWRVVELDCIVDISKKTINPLRYPDTYFTHYSLPACDNAMNPEKQLGMDIMSNKIVLSDNTTLFSKLNPRIKRIWFTHIVEENSICSTEFIPYRAKNEKLYSFVYSTVNSDAFYNSVMSFVNGATGSHQRFHVDDTLKLKYAINENVVESFCTCVNPILDKIHSLRTENAQLSSLRNSLLPKLMSGELKTGDLHR